MTVSSQQDTQSAQSGEAQPGNAQPGAAGLSIGEAARRLGVSVHTLRYYEREGLLNVPRRAHVRPSRSAQRRYGEGELEVLGFLLALRATGMPMGFIRRYIALVRLGDETVTERRELLVEHQRAVTAQIAALGNSLKAIEAKIGKYDHTGHFTLGGETGANTASAADTAQRIATQGAN
ncbi:MerR family transcriptional regulator [Deinococcus altitudinis]|uniref:MerR family transcriptional regulator n=1 Tax=Deinococcus altitudinis TaxID=468914 RepID=UPI0038929010